MRWNDKTHSSSQLSATLITTLHNAHYHSSTTLIITPPSRHSSQPRDAHHHSSATYQGNGKAQSDPRHHWRRPAATAAALVGEYVRRYGPAFKTPARKVRCTRGRLAPRRSPIWVQGCTDQAELFTPRGPPRYEGPLHIYRLFPTAICRGSAAQDRTVLHVDEVVGRPPSGTRTKLGDLYHQGRI